MILIVKGTQVSVGDVIDDIKILSWHHPTRRRPLGQVFVEINGKPKVVIPAEIGGKFL